MIRICQDLRKLSKNNLIKIINDFVSITDKEVALKLLKERIEKLEIPRRNDK